MTKKIALILVSAFLLAACNQSPLGGKATPTPDNRRQLINVLEMGKRPFVAVFPHPTNKLLTLYIDRVQTEFKMATFDLEYLSGNALKGGRTSLSFPVPLPHAQAFLLGSCSSGGKCSFDTDLISGNLKNRLETGEIGGAINILKSEFFFVAKTPISTSDSRVTYTSKDKLVNQIFQDTQGLPQAVEGELAYTPLAIAATSNKKISGLVNYAVKDVKSVKIFDGDNWQPLKADITPEAVNITLNQTPWSRTVQIVRDDLKGAGETQTLYLVGPILLLK